MSFNVDLLRNQFPSLNRPTPDGAVPVFFDNPAGTQVPGMVLAAVGGYYIHNNANSGGVFATSIASDAMVQTTRERTAAFLNAASADEIVFGQNMTTLNFALSRAIAQTLSAGDEIVVTRMDHDANISPWLRIAEDRGLTVRWVDVNTDDCTLDMQGLADALNPRTKVVATVYASNAVGTINPIAQIAQMAHAVGAIHVVDAVQAAPHILIDVQALGCDFLMCSAYKFFGPHLGILWGRYDLLASLPAYKVRPAHDAPPDRWETGTPAFELIAGLGATLDYLSSLAGTADGVVTRQSLQLALGRIGEHERDLITHLIDMLQTVPGLRVAGITDPARYAERVPTVVFTKDGYTSTQVAGRLAEQAIYVWDGNYYAVEVVKRLGHGEDGMVRVGVVHYNTHQEIDRLEAALKAL